MLTPIAVCLGLPLATVPFFSGCSSLSVTDSRFSAVDRKLSTPPSIFVKPYTVAEGSLRVDRTGEKLEVFKSEVSDQMAERLATRLTEHIAPALLLAANHPSPEKHSWIV